MVIHELWLIPLVLRKVEDSFHVFILILCHLVVEHEGVEIYYFLLFIVCLAFKKIWLRQCQLLHCVKMVDIG